MYCIFVSLENRNLAGEEHPRKMTKYLNELIKLALVRLRRHAGVKFGDDDGHSGRPITIRETIRFVVNFAYFSGGDAIS